MTAGIRAGRRDIARLRSATRMACSGTKRSALYVVASSMVHAPSDATVTSMVHLAAQEASLRTTHARGIRGGALSMDHLQVGIRGKRTRTRFCTMSAGIGAQVIHG